MGPQQVLSMQRMCPGLPRQTHHDLEHGAPPGQAPAAYLKPSHACWYLEATSRVACSRHHVDSTWPFALLEVVHKTHGVVCDQPAVNQELFVS